VRSLKKRSIGRKKEEGSKVPGVKEEEDVRRKEEEAKFV